MQASSLSMTSSLMLQMETAQLTLLALQVVATHTGIRMQATVVVSADLYPFNFTLRPTYLPCRVCDSKALRHQHHMFVRSNSNDQQLSGNMRTL